MSRASLVRLVVLATIWGSSFLWMALALEGLAPVQIVLGRLLAATAVLGLVVAGQRRRLPREPVVWLHLWLMGVVANIVPFFAFAWGQQHITSGLAGVLNGTTPLFTLMFALAALPVERLSAARAAGLVTGFAGVVLVVGPWDSNPLTSSIPGQLACLGASACYGAAFTYTRRFITPRGYPPLVMAVGQLGMAALTLTLASPLVVRAPADPTPVVVGSVLILGALGTGIAYLLYYRLIVDAGATSASMVTYLVPVVAVALGAAALGEPVTWNLFAGGAVVILGVALAEGRIPPRRRRPVGVAGTPAPAPPAGARVSRSAPARAPTPRRRPRGRRPRGARGG